MVFNVGLCSIVPNHFGAENTDVFQIQHDIIKFTRKGTKHYLMEEIVIYGKQLEVDSLYSPCN